MVADEIDDREAVLALPSAQPAAELLQEDDRRLGRAQHQHRVDLGHVEAFVKDVDAEHDLEPAVAQRRDRLMPRRARRSAVDGGARNPVFCEMGGHEVGVARRDAEAERPRPAVL